jgi:hypothetical protein
MNAFEKFDADRAQRRHNLILAWSEFRAATNASVASFNKIEEGIANPAKIEESPYLVSVSCKRLSSSGIGMLSVIAKMTVTETKRVAIVARVEFWSLGSDLPSEPQDAENFEFLVEAESEVCLSFEGEKLKPAEAADTVLLRALLGLPAKSNNITAVNKRNRDAA